MEIHLAQNEEPARRCGAGAGLGGACPLLRLGCKLQAGLPRSTDKCNGCQVYARAPVPSGASSQCHVGCWDCPPVPVPAPCSGFALPGYVREVSSLPSCCRDLAPSDGGRHAGHANDSLSLCSMCTAERQNCSRGNFASLLNWCNDCKPGHRGTWGCLEILPRVVQDAAPRERREVCKRD